MITSNVLNRIFHLKYGEGTGTCFAIDYEQRQYMVTAKHVVEGLKNGDTIELYHNGKWSVIQVNVIGHHHRADVSVFSINFKLGHHEMEPTTAGLAYGQDMYFLGFPYRLQDEASGPINRDFPFPLVKKAILSAFMFGESDKYLLLDGINNPGFSGGPVIFTEPNKYEYKVAAVISGYRFENEPAYLENEATTLSVRINTGIIIAYSITNAIDLIKSNPIGLVL